MKTSAVRRGLTESAFIVIGILVAFSIDAWWDNHQESKMHRAILDSLAGEVARNQSLLDRDLGTMDDHLDRIDRFLRSTPDELGQFAADSIGGYTNAFGNPVTYDPEIAVATMVMNLPARDTRGLSIQELTGRWLRVMADSEEQANALWSIIEGIWPLLARHGLPYASDGLQSMTQMSSRVGARGLGEMRADPEFTTSVVIKGQMQGNYRGQMRNSAALLDSLASLVATAR